MIERLAASAAPRKRSAGTVEVLLVGSRGLRMAHDLGLPVAWSAPMVTQADEIAGLADRLAGELYRRLAGAAAARVSLIHSTPERHGAEAGEAGAGAGPRGDGIVERLLLPFDFSRFPAARSGAPPLTTLPPGRLLEQLAREYVFAELGEALTLSRAAEDEARMRAMTGARSNIARMREKLEQEFRQLRQARITAEVVELSAGRRARRGSAPRENA